MANASPAIGVAWSTPAMEKPKVIQNWPGGDVVINKVRTAVTYRAGSVRIHSWGSRCPPPRQLRHGMDVKEYFKLFLDEASLKKAFEGRPDDSPGIEEVQLWFLDYLRQVYDHITKYFQEGLKYTADQWSWRSVEYIFSVPSTWTEHSVIEDYRKIAKKAGFGTGKNHSVEVGLTEPEASAVHTAKDQGHKFQIGDILLVCDAGGGTTDTSVMEVLPMEGGSIRLEQISVVEGIAVGSVQIDDSFMEKVERRLELVRNDFPRLPSYVAQEMVKGKFQDIKKVFGQPLGSLLDSCAVAVPDLPPDYSNSDAGIEYQEMVFSRDEVKELFDKQVERIFNHIDPQVEQSMGDGRETKRVSCLILSGGLGSSVYLQDRFKARYGNHGRTKVLISHDPQLAVCRGLVTDRIQRIKHGTSILRTRRCRASYGILFNEPYSRRKHIGQTPHKGPIDGNEYAIDQVDWFITRGQAITDGQPIVRRYSRIADADNPEKVWRDKIVICRLSLPPENLPQRLVRDQGVARVICEIKSDLQSHSLDESTDGVTKRPKHWWGFGAFGKKYLKIDHEVVVTVGPADLSFQIRFDGRSWNENKVLPVEWMNEQDIVVPEETEEKSWVNGLVSRN